MRWIKDALQRYVNPYEILVRVLNEDANLKNVRIVFKKGNWIAAKNFLLFGDDCETALGIMRISDQIHEIADELLEKFKKEGVI